MTNLQPTRSDRPGEDLHAVQLSAVGDRPAQVHAESAAANANTATAETPPPPQVSGIRRVVYIVLAFAFLGLGLLGAILPGLPTTPFLLLTSYFLVRSSPELHAKVMRIPLVGRFLNDWREKRAIRPRVKAVAIVTVLIVLGISLAVSVLPVYVKVVIASLAAVGLTVIWRLPTTTDAAAAHHRR